MMLKNDLGITYIPLRKIQFVITFEIFSMVACGVIRGPLIVLRCVVNSVFLAFNHTVSPGLQFDAERTVIARLDGVNDPAGVDIAGSEIDLRVSGRSRGRMEDRIVFGLCTSAVIILDHYPA
jgi:hypothetical protein